MKIATIISNLPTYTQISVLYPLLGSLNLSAINSAQRLVSQELRDLEAASKASRNVISIDKYNELLNELKQREQEDEHTKEIGFDKPERNRSAITLDNVMLLRAPLIGLLNAAQAKLPSRDEPADFSFEESLARQLAREFSVQAIADAEMEAALIESGATTKDEIEAADKARFEADKAFKHEFKFLILDHLRDAEADAGDVDLDTADVAFNELGEDFQRRIVQRMIPKLHEAKMQNLGRRSFDPDASTNVLIIGMALNELRTFLGDSEADDKLAKMKAALAA